MLSVSTNGIRVTNLTSLKLSGRREKMRNYLGSSLKRAQSNGRR